MRTHSVRRSRVQKILPRIFQYFILTTVVVIVLVPIVLAIFGALKTRGEFMASPYSLPIPPRWDNFILIFELVGSLQAPFSGSSHFGFPASL